ncbi:MAG: serine/threonine protein kinase [Candidatus Obscuribacterales bacterium]|nr:serine/threonine protein kinase [Candidatus Obscuribacterales bacterium]
MLEKSKLLFFNTREFEVKNMSLSCSKCSKLIFGVAEYDDLRRQFCSKECKANMNKATANAVAQTEEAVIFCWPYRPAAAGQTLKRANDPVIVVVGIFTIVWLITMVSECHLWSIFNNFMLLKAAPFLFLPLLGTVNGLTHIRINGAGMVLETACGKSIVKSKAVPWSSIRSIRFEPPGKNKSVLAGKLVIEHATTTKVSLSKIRSGEQWRKLVEAVEAHANCELDSRLLDGFDGETIDDPSYTRLWLDSLSAPPKRERLQPLSAGASLQKGQFIIERIIGSGGQGSAYLARSTDDNQVVLKEYILPVYVDVRVRKEALTDFQDEANLLKTLRDDGIVKCLSSFVEDHRAYLVLEHIRGRSLRELVTAGGRMPEALCLKYAMSMSRILTYLQSRSRPIVHRDFTPDNLMVSDENGSLKLIDFMLAQQNQDAEAESIVVGKPQYMPPEQFRGKATPASDLYALGCTLHFLLTGEDPAPMTPSHPMLLNASVSPEFDSVISRLTALYEKSRYRSAVELTADLAALFSSRETVRARSA